jgi:predicted ATPase
VLLILDNCEHLVEACASLADVLLRAWPNVRILATSREPLGVAGDLALPAAELVGPTGHVFGVDQNPGVLETATARAEASGLTNISFHAGDLNKNIPGNDFDAVVGRLVLLYVPDPAG